VSPTHCGSCGALLTGPYGAKCGRHARESARSVAVLLHDAATHVDPPMQTLFHLLLRPGRLSREYFADPRGRFLPPVRSIWS
jgi:hypothetical protein